MLSYDEPVIKHQGNSLAACFIIILYRNKYSDKINTQL
jgi:hypothetical protein